MMDFLYIAAKDNRSISDKILAGFIDCKIDGSSIVYKDSRYALSKNRDRFILFCSNDDMSRHVAINGGGGEGYTFFDGMLLQDDCITDVRKLSPLINKKVADHSDLFGRYIYGTFSDTGRNHIHRDVLGYEPLFIGFSEETTVISNFPNLAAQGLFGEDYRKNKNLLALAQVTIAKSGQIFDLTTSFKNVFFVPQNAGILIDERNKVSYYSMVNSMYHKMPQGIKEKHLERAIEDSKKLFRKAYIDNGNITGGYDSRVGLAIAISAGIHKDIKFTIRGMENHPDVLVAKQIAAYYGLNLEHQTASIPDVSEFMPNIFSSALERQYKQAGMRSFSEDLANTTVYWANKKANVGKEPVNISTPRFRMSLTGAAHDQLRGCYSLPLQLEGVKNRIMIDKDREFLISWMGIKQNAFSSCVYEYLHEKLKRHFQTYEDLYSVDLLYDEAHDPQFHGGLNHRDLFSIGMHPWFHRLAMIETPEFRAADRIGFKIIEKTTPELLYFPFAGKTWPPLAYAGHKDEERLRQIMPVENVAEQPLPSQTDLDKKMRFVFDANIELHDEIWKVYSEGFLKSIINKTQAALSGAEPINTWVLHKLLDVYGNSMFMDNMEKSLVQEVLSQPLCKGELSSITTLYKPNLYFVEHASDVTERGELLFQKNKIFRHKDHDNFKEPELPYTKIMTLLRKLRQWGAGE